MPLSLSCFSHPGERSSTYHLLQCAIPFHGEANMPLHACAMFVHAVICSWSVAVVDRAAVPIIAWVLDLCFQWFLDF